MLKRNTILIFITIIFLFFSCEEKKIKKISFAETVENNEVAVDSVFREKSLAIDKYFQNIHKRRGFNGCALVAQNGKVIYKKAFGWADFKTKEPLKTASAFQLASVSKQFTAVAIMMLKEKGKLNYDDDVQKFIPEFPYQNISIRMLLAHRSGLPNYTYFCDHLCPDKETPISNKKVIQMFAQHRPPLYFRPNRRHQYSNTGYCVLAAIVEKISEKPFENFMKREVFEPMGMHHSLIYNKANFPEIPNQVSGYILNGRKAEPDFLDGVVGDKGVYSTVEDLYRWDMALHNGKFLKKSTLEEAHTPANKDLRGNRNYGFGWRIYFNETNEKIVYHGGWWHGFKTYFMRNIPKETTVIILTNREYWNFSDINSLLGIVYPNSSAPTDDTQD